MHLLFASSSRYGANHKAAVSAAITSIMISIYAATKKANELMAHAIASLRIPATGLRFSRFTAVGTADMAMFIFARLISQVSRSALQPRPRCGAISFVDDVSQASGSSQSIHPPADGPIGMRAGRIHPAAPRPGNLPIRHNRRKSDIRGRSAERSLQAGREELLPMQPGDVESTMPTSPISSATCVSALRLRSRTASPVSRNGIESIQV